MSLNKKLNLLYILYDKYKIIGLHNKRWRVC